MYQVLDTLRLTLLHIGNVQLNHEWRFDNVISPFSRLYLITEGSGWVIHNHQKIFLRPNRLYLIPSFTDSQYHCDESLGQYYISFLDSIQGGMSIYNLVNVYYERNANPNDYYLMRRLLELNPGRTILRSDPKTYDNRPELLQYDQRRTQPYEQYLESQGILKQLFSRFVNMERGVEPQKLKAYVRLGSLLSFIDENLATKLTVQELASTIHLHPDYFSRLFLSILGIRPSVYIHNRRLEHAQFLLASTKMTVSEVASKVGISNFSYFSRSFKTKFGMTPGAFRKVRVQV